MRGKERGKEEGGKGRMGSGELWLACHRWGVHSISTPQIPSLVPISYFHFPHQSSSSPSTGIRDHLPPAAACRTEGRRGKIPAIILNNETGAFVIPFCNKSRTQNTRESAAHSWTAPVSWIVRAFEPSNLKNSPAHHIDPFPYNAEEQRHDKGKETCKTADDGNG